MAKLTCKVLYDVRLIRDKITDMSRGFAFVELASADVSGKNYLSQESDICQMKLTLLLSKKLIIIPVPTCLYYVMFVLEICVRNVGKFFSYKVHIKWVLLNCSLGIVFYIVIDTIKSNLVLTSQSSLNLHIMFVFYSFAFEMSRFFIILFFRMPKCC